MSFSVSEGTAVYVPLRHKTGRNAGSPDKIMQWLAKSVFENKEIVKIAHNLSFEAMFLYASASCRSRPAMTPSRRRR